MDYIQGLPEQARVFLLSLGFGFILGILYDVFRIVRLVVSPGRRIVIIYDVVYVALSAVLSFLFFLAVNDGSVRAFSLFALLLGWLVYYLSLGIFVIKISEALVRFTRRLIYLITRPFVFVFGIIRRLLRRFRRFLSKNIKKLLKKSKFLLKLYTAMVYNLNRIAVYTKKQE